MRTALNDRVYHHGPSPVLHVPAAQHLTMLCTATWLGLKTRTVTERLLQLHNTIGTMCCHCMACSRPPTASASDFLIPLLILTSRTGCRQVHLFCCIVQLCLQDSGTLRCNINAPRYPCTSRDTVSAPGASDHSAPVCFVSNVWSASRAMCFSS